MSQDDSLEDWERQMADGLNRMLGPTQTFGNASRIVPRNGTSGGFGSRHWSDG